VVEGEERAAPQQPGRTGFVGSGPARVADHAPPTWPTQDRPQQMHLDMLVDDLDAAEAAVVALGASRHPHQTGTSFRTFLDPAGHPFCLCLD
jgi:hypothetical protein